jgi:hypothetical protein
MIRYEGHHKHTFDLSKIKIRECKRVIYILEEEEPCYEEDGELKWTILHQIARLETMQEAEELLRALRAGEAAEKFLGVLGES